MTVATDTTEQLTFRGLVHSTDLRTLALWAAPAALLLERDAGPPDPDANLEGVWDLHVRITGETGDNQVTTRFEFRPDHTVKALGPTLEDGDPEFVVIGYWMCLPGGEFAFGVNHPGMPDGRGAAHGAIFGFHRGRVDGAALATEGRAVVELGERTGVVTVRTKGVRVDVP